MKKINWWKIEEDEGDNRKLKIADVLKKRQDEGRSWDWEQRHPEVMDAVKVA